MEVDDNSAVQPNFPAVAVVRCVRIFSTTNLANAVLANVNTLDAHRRCTSNTECVSLVLIKSKKLLGLGVTGPSSQLELEAHTVGAVLVTHAHYTNVKVLNAVGVNRG